VQRVKGPVGYIRAKDDERSLRQIHDIHDAPYQREAKAYRCVEAPKKKPVDDVLRHDERPPSVMSHQG
jgi:hypothetical protein